MSITGKQIAMARILLDLNQNDLAEKLGIARKTIMRIENGQSPGSTKTLDAIQNFFEHQDIVFFGKTGIKKRSNEVKVLKGHSGFAQFRQNVLETAKKGHADICISNCDERQFYKWGMGKVNEDYRNKMAAVRKKDPTLRFRTLTLKNDTFFAAAQHTEYKWVPETEFGNFPFYVFGDNTAMIMFEDNDITLFIISHPEIAAYYRIQFNMMWEKADDIPKSKLQLPKQIKITPQ